MRFATWNLNSVRSRSEQLIDWLVDRRVDVALLQETKCTDTDFPFATLQAAGYDAVHHGVNHWNGVAIVSRVSIGDVCRGFATNDQLADEPLYTWWNYVGTQFAKDKGLRIDMAFGSPSILSRTNDVWVDRRTRDPLVVEPAKPSDHAPLVVDLNVG